MMFVNVNTSEIVFIISESTDNELSAAIFIKF